MRAKEDRVPATVRPVSRTRNLDSHRAGKGDVGSSIQHWSACPGVEKRVTVFELYKHYLMVVADQRPLACARRLG